MASQNVEHTPPARKPPRVVKSILSSDAQILQPCARCERPVFWCIYHGPWPLGRETGDERGRVPIHVHAKRRGRIGIQTLLGSAELVAVDVSKSARTWYGLHRCRKGRAS